MHAHKYARNILINKVLRIFISRRASIVAKSEDTLKLARFHDVRAERQ